MKCIVYGLYSTREPDELRYIGQTTQPTAHRLSQHRHYAKNKQTAVHKWFLREEQAGYAVELRVLRDDAEFNVTEKELIAEHRSSGARLLNLTDGGEGTVGWRGNKGNKRPDLSEFNRRYYTGRPGRPMSEENKAKLIAANKARDTTYLVIRNKTNHPWIGKKHTAEWFAKMRGRTVSEETRQRQSAALKGIVKSPEWRAKIGAASKGRVHSPETREKIRLANLARWAIKKGQASA
jgi:hypothetical protein